MDKISRLAVVGGGSWATALVKIFSESGTQVSWYLRSSKSVAHIKKEGRNPNYLTFLHLRKENIDPSDVLEEVIQAAEYILLAVPSAYLESTLSGLDPQLMKDKKVIFSIKGVVPGHHVVPSEFVRLKYNVPHERQFVIGGPCHAEEVALERKTYMTIAGDDKEKVAALCDMVDLDYVKTVANYDPMGVELSAIMKNIIGIACGMARGLNYGDNFQAVLVSNALKEIRQFLEALDQRQRELSQSGYFGDLLVTAYSEYSRNRTFGQMIGRGFSVDLAQSEMKMVAEGYYAVNGIYKMARKLNCDMPIVFMVYRILYNKISPYVEFKHIEQILI